jgi:hypothetical protein
VVKVASKVENKLVVPRGKPMSKQESMQKIEQYKLATERRAEERLHPKVIVEEKESPSVEPLLQHT